MQSEQLLRIPEAAELLTLRPVTIRAWLVRRKLSFVRVGRSILLELGLLSGPRLVSCPTCGRCKVDLRLIAEEVERALQEIAAPIVVAVMGCEVNGPGEAKAADIGLACGGDYAVIFREGELIKRVKMSEATGALLAEIRVME